MSTGPPRGAELLASPVAAATFATIERRGYEATSLVEIAARAGTGAAALERGFGGKPGLVLALFEAVAEDYKAAVGAAFEAGGAWPDSLRAAAWAMARWILANPGAIRFGMVGVLGAGDMVLVRREELLRWCAGLVEAGRAVAPDPDGVPAAAPLMAVGAIAETLRRHQEGSLEADVVGSVPEMMYSAVRPYLGEAAARRELEIPPPADLRDGPR